MEPDFIMSGEMELYVTGRPYAQSEDDTSAPYVFDQDTNKIDMREQRMMAIGQRDVSKSQEGHVFGVAYCGAPIVPRHAARVMHATDYRRYCSRNSQITRLASKSCVVRPIRNSGRYWTPRGQV